MIGKKNNTNSLVLKSRIRLLADRLTKATWLALWVGGLGVFLVAMTLIATWEGVRTSRNSAKNETRAYVHAKVAGFSMNDPPFVYLEVANSGNTPAHWFEIASVSHLWEKENVNIEDAVNFDNIGEYSRWSALAGGGTFLTAPTGSLFESHFTEQAMDAEQPDWFLVYGIIRYSTIFDEIFETQFVFVKRKPAASTEENKIFLDRPNIMLDVFKDVTEEYRKNNA